MSTWGVQPQPSGKAKGSRVDLLAVLRAERERFHSVLDALPVYVVLLRSDYHVPFANRVFIERFGPGNGRRCFEHLFNRSQPCEVCQTFKVLKTNAPTQWEWVGPDGRTYSVFGFPFKESDGSTLILEMGIDVTERKQTQAELDSYRFHLEALVKERTRQLEIANTELQGEIAERKRTEDELREVSQRLTYHVNHSPLAVIEWDADMRLVRWAGEAERMFGWTAAEVLGKTMHEFPWIPAEDAQQVAAVQADLQSGANPRRFSANRNYRKDGSVAHCEWYNSALLDGAGRARSILSLVLDVTEQKKAAQKVTVQNAVLEGINRIFREALSCETEEDLGRVCLEVAEAVTGSQFGFIGELNTRGRLCDIAISDPGWAACAMSSRTGHGKLTSDLEVHGLYGRVILDAKGSFTNDPSSDPHSVGTPGGHPILTSFLGVPLLRNGKPAGVVAVANKPGGYNEDDLQSLESLSVAMDQALLHKRAETALQKAQANLRSYAEDLEKTVARRTAKLQEAVSELEHFSYAITHDLRAPLRAMQGFASILEEDCLGCQQGSQQYFRRIKLASSRMDQLITDSLNYSKAVRQELTLASVDLGELLKGLVEIYPNLQSDKADIHIASGFPKVMGNEAALTQCFSNLLGNAVKFAKPGTKPNIQIRAEERCACLPCAADASNCPPAGPSRTLVRVWVEDDGIGIPKLAHEHIFGIFQRGSTNQEGSGVGLAIVRKVVQRMGGAVGVESEEGRGSRFWVDLAKAP